ncbi:MAG: enoyl-CoA hydratase-related protein [Dehalococcoidia bacterium]|jgi:enoyl-CoA hydratase/carnithine racemase
MAYDTLILDKEGMTGIITLNRPPANPFNYAAVDNLGKALTELEKDKDVRAVIITGGGETAFSAGFDVKSFADPMNVWMPRFGHIVYNKIERFPKPVIAAINGFALGGGFELALACHFRLMVDAEKAVLGLPEINLGIIPGWGGTQRLPRLIGRTRALEVALMGKRLNAKEAYEWGLLNKVSKPGEVLNDAKVYATALSKRAPLALKSILNAMIMGQDTNMAAGIELELAGSEIVRNSKDATEGMMAFIEKREAKFTGE